MKDEVWVCSKCNQKVGPEGKSGLVVLESKKGNKTICNECQRKVEERDHHGYDGDEKT